MRTLTPGDEEINYSGSTTVTDACITTFSFSTTGFRGGDAGHGGYLEITMEDEGGTCMEVTTIREPGRCDVIKLRFSGDSEISNAVAGLRFLSSNLNKLLRP
jgi:hypothetical protein